LQFKPFGEINEADWEGMIGVNLKGAYFCAQKAVALMGEKGKIINISSISSGGMGIAYPMISHYTTSKGGVVGMTEALAVELGPKINVNAIAPGGVDTDMGKSAGDEKTRQMLMMRIPKRRMGKPEDIGAVAAFLASDEADYVTGTVIYVDGGWLAA
jgi:NAD(P)-dependent dehydrogenase (short-subunit alcohol dehydrogenase family)